MAELDAKEQEAFEAMRTTFNNEEGFGLPMNDVTYGRYLRARLVILPASIDAYYL